MNPSPSHTKFLESSICFCFKFKFLLTLDFPLPFFLLSSNCFVFNPLVFDRRLLLCLAINCCSLCSVVANEEDNEMASTTSRKKMDLQLMILDSSNCEKILDME